MKFIPRTNVCALQLLLDVGQGDIGDANTTAVALHTLSSLSRNLPASEIFLFPSEDTKSLHSFVPNPITLIMGICDRFWPTAEVEAEYRECTVCRQIMSRGLGLLMNWTANNKDVKQRMISSPVSAAAWNGAQHLDLSALHSKDVIEQERKPLGWKLDGTLVTHAGTCLLV
jgi:hypothetical protein